MKSNQPSEKQVLIGGLELSQLRHPDCVPSQINPPDFDTNWARNLTYSSARLHFPKTMDQLRDAIVAAEKVKVLGSRHCFNQIADTSKDHISLALMRDIHIDPMRSEVTVSGPVTYGELSSVLERTGFALENLASLPHISIVGACATATHGSGDRNQSLASSVSAVEFMAANGEIVKLSRRDNYQEFVGAVVSLGGLGVVTKLTLGIVPTFKVSQHVYENLPFHELSRNFDSITSAAYSVSLFTDWRSDSINQVWLKRRIEENYQQPYGQEFFGATPASSNRHPAAGVSPESCTEQLGVPGPWYQRLPHFKMEFTPSIGAELQSEFIVPRTNALAALTALATIRDSIKDSLIVSEIRTIAADDLWLSPFNGQDSVGIHFTWKDDAAAVKSILPEIEARLIPYGARPHWGKLFSMERPQLEAAYPMLPRFRELLNQYDPTGKFRNPFLDSII